MENPRYLFDYHCLEALERIATLGSFEKAAKDGEENLIPHMMEAFDNDATLGEICDLLRSVWGEYRPKEII